MQKVADISAHNKCRDQSAIQQQQVSGESCAGAGGLDASRFAIMEAERQKNLGHQALVTYIPRHKRHHMHRHSKHHSKIRRKDSDQAWQWDHLGTQAQMAEQADIAQQMGMGGMEPEDLQQSAA